MLISTTYVAFVIVTKGELALKSLHYAISNASDHEVSLRSGVEEFNVMENRLLCRQSFLLTRNISNSTSSKTSLGFLFSMLSEILWIFRITVPMAHICGIKYFNIFYFDSVTDHVDSLSYDALVIPVIFFGSLAFDAS